MVEECHSSIDFVFPSLQVKRHKLLYVRTHTTYVPPPQGVKKDLSRAIE